MMSFDHKITMYFGFDDNFISENLKTKFQIDFWIASSSAIRYFAVRIFQNHLNDG